MRPSEGVIRTRGRLAALLELGAGFHGDLTGRENLYLNGSILGFSKTDVNRIFDDVVDFAEIAPFIDMQVKHYSSGMTARLGFALAIHVDPDIVLVDEVLSVGDESFQRKCLERVREMQAEGRTILVVTHAADLLRQICQQGVVLDRGEVVATGDPGPTIRAFRDSLIQRGLAFAEGLEGDEADLATERELSRKVRFTDVNVVYPGTERYLEPGQSLRIECAYDATERIDDVVFAINIFDPDGHLIVGTNSDVVDEDIDYVEGTGVVTFDFETVPLLDGDYEFHVGMHSHEGEEYDHFESKEPIQVMNRGRMVGRVTFPLHFEHQRSSDRSVPPPKVDSQA